MTDHPSKIEEALSQQFGIKNDPSLWLTQDELYAAIENDKGRAPPMGISISKSISNCFRGRWPTCLLQ